MLRPVGSRRRARWVRHNRIVRAFRHRWFVMFAPLVAALALGGCGDANRTSGAQTTVPGFDSPVEELAWEGTVACSDCDGIQTQLRLQRGNGVVAQYELQEAFLDGEGAEYFREEGRWRRDGRVLHLQPSVGGERLYAIDGAGNLVAIDRRGHAAGPGRTLTPVGPPNL